MNYYEKAIEMGVPEHTAKALETWIVEGLTGQGSFIMSVLRNDLSEAFANADLKNRNALHNIVSFLYNYAPMNCWKSPENVLSWEGLRKAS